MKKIEVAGVALALLHQVCFWQAAENLPKQTKWSLLNTTATSKTNL